MISDPKSVEVIVSSVASLFAIWWLVFFAFRDYRIDLFRHRLFRLREDLFLFAAGGGIAFDHPAHRMLRMTINGMIRYGDRVGVIWLGFLYSAFQHRDCRAAEDLLHREWLDANRSLPEATREQLVAFRRDLHWILVHHVVTSPGLVVITYPVSLAMYVRIVRLAARNWVERKMAPTFEKLDSVALLEARDAARHAA